MKFSITIPTYKARYLQEAIDSVLAQTYVEWELIIVNDCSPEDIDNIVHPYLKDNRIRYYRNDRNCGAYNVIDNWNICLSYCTGDYVICIGDDDCLLPCCLEEYAKLIDRYPNLNVYHAWTEVINEKSIVINLQEPRPEWESALSLIWNRWAFRYLQFIGDFCYKTIYLKSVGGYYKLPLAWGSDDITAVLAAQDKGIANTQKICFQYRQNSQTITNSTKNAKTKILTRKKQYEWYKCFLNRVSLSKNLTLLDKKYLLTIENVKATNFYGSFDKDCPNYIKGSPLRLWWCYQQINPLFHYSCSTFLKWYIKSIL